MKFAFVFLAAGLTAAPAALAQSVDTQQVPDLPIRSTPPPAEGAPQQPTDTWKVSVGGGLSYAPRYEGSASDRWRPMPLLEANYGHWFISPLRGAGYDFSDNRDMQYGVRLSLGHARKQNADGRLNGMGNIGYSLESGLFFNVRFAPFYISSGISTGVHGTHAELGTGIGFPVSDADRLRFGVNMNWGDTKYNQTYFGVTQAQATASGNVLTPYDATAGVKDIALTGNWTHNYSKEWFSNAGLSFKRLTGSAQYSPLTMRREMTSVNFLLGYRF